jgi:hypothetical protein
MQLLRLSLFIALIIIKTNKKRISVCSALVYVLSVGSFHHMETLLFRRRRLKCLVKLEATGNDKKRNSFHLEKKFCCN